MDITILYYYISRLMPGFVYTIKNLKKEFGKKNVILSKINNINYACVDVLEKDQDRNISAKLSKLGLMFSKKHKQYTPGSFNLQLKKNPGYNICLIIESDIRGSYQIMIQQINNIPVIGTIVYYICNNDLCYKLNYW